MMAVKTRFTREDLLEILSHYDLGVLTRAEPILQGTVQTNYFLHTVRGRFVLRYYENRSWESVLFERDLLLHLASHRYPSPAPVPNAAGSYAGEYRGKPFLILHAVDGRPLERPADRHWTQLVARAAELQTITAAFRSPYTAQRWNYSPALCLELARQEAERLNTPAGRAKLDWVARALEALELPPSLPRAICHCDLHYTNLLFQGDELVAVLDFDDANWTYSQFDLVGLVEHRAWPHRADVLDLAAAHTVVEAYRRHRPLSPLEQRHLIDVYQLGILFDAIWYFERGTADDCRERRKIDALRELGRERFCAALFTVILTS